MDSLIAEFELASRQDVASSLRECIRTYLSANADGVATEEDLIVVELAVSEAASNICRHAYKGQTDRPIWFVIENDGDELVMQLSHLGEPPRVEEIPPPVFDGSKEGGFGMFIIEQCMDTVEYGVDDTRKAYVRLKKKLGRGLPGNEPEG